MYGLPVDAVTESATVDALPELYDTGLDGYRVADLGVIAPLDATTGEVLGIIAATASRERSLGRLLTRSERLLVLVDVCGEVECLAIRSRVSIDVLEVVARGRMGQLDAHLRGLYPPRARDPGPTRRGRPR